jgi:hypothetical protein
MQDDQEKMTELHVRLQPEEGWPPIAVEGVPCSIVEQGYRVEMPPLFIKDISVGDIIAIRQIEGDVVFSWKHVSKSNNTTIWLLRLIHDEHVANILAKLRAIGCNTVGLPQYGSYAIDVPGTCEIKQIDDVLAQLDKSRTAIAYPSFRHEQ